jgi:2-C-methyl-D-erythritol 2,4-cyclodiphosphate synthase
MKNQLSTILNIENSRVNIKATTCEKLGFIGRKEGIACQAIASLKLSLLS